MVNFWPPCGNSPAVQNVFILVQFVSKIDWFLPRLILYFQRIHNSLVFERNIDNRYHILIIQFINGSKI